MSILAGLEAIFDRRLGVEGIGSTAPHYRHRKSAQWLSKGRPSGFNASELLDEAYATLLANLTNARRFLAEGPSQQNWRLEKRVGLTGENRSPETNLERRIARATGPDCANQVPTASGLWGEAADKRSAVDLVWRRTDGSFELIELKVRSDTPLRAAVEILMHALLYALARQHYAADARLRTKLLQAHEVHVRVLAPQSYYEGFNLQWLERGLDAGLRRFAQARFGHELFASFRFEAFPDAFRIDAAPPELLHYMKNRREVWADPNARGRFPSRSGSFRRRTQDASLHMGH